MNILITGIHGFVGSHLVRTLAKEHTIWGLDIVHPTVEGVTATLSWDDLERSDLPPFDAIIHLAGKAHDLKNESLDQVYFEINTELTKKIYTYFLSSKAKKFFFFSSVKAAADYVDGDVLLETVLPNPKGPYGESKIAAENYLLAHMSEDKQTYILRPSMIHGPNNKGNLSLLYNVVSKGIPWPLGAFENKRSFTSIGNVSFILQSMLRQDVTSGIYHLADDEPIATNDLIRLICLSVNKKALILHIPKSVMTSLSKLGGLLHLPLNQDRLTKLTENYVVSNEKIKQALGVKNLPITAKECLVFTLNSFRK